MVVVSTPRVVEPPLPPENWMQGGEYGSPGTCFPLHLVVLAGRCRGLAGCGPVVVVAPAMAPGAVAAPPTGAAPLTPPGAPVPFASLSVTRSRALVGTNAAMSTKASNRQANGP